MSMWPYERKRKTDYGRNEKEIEKKKEEKGSEECNSSDGSVNKVTWI